MDIKNLKPTGPYKNGILKNLKNPNKYIGDINRIIYRSSYEYIVYTKLCDINDRVIKWSVEPSKLAIKYKHPLKKNNDGSPKISTYYPDIYLEILQNDGSIKRILGEIKPEIKITKPEPIAYNSTKEKRTAYNKKMLVYAVNIAKMNAAKEFCLKCGMEYFFITESIINKL